MLEIRLLSDWISFESLFLLKDIFFWQVMNKRKSLKTRDSKNSECAKALCTKLNNEWHTGLSVTQGAAAIKDGSTDAL